MVTVSQLVAAGVPASRAGDLAAKISTLSPMVQNRYANTVVQFYQTYGNQGYDLDINQAARTPATQSAIQATGVKAASPRNSWHTVGGAADFTIYKDGVRDKGTAYNNPYVSLLSPIAQQNGLNNPIRGDVGHFQAAEFPAARGGRDVAQYVTAPGVFAFDNAQTAMDAIAANFGVPNTSNDYASLAYANPTTTAPQTAPQVTPNAPHDLWETFGHAYLPKTSVPAVTPASQIPNPVLWEDTIPRGPANVPAAPHLVQAAISGSPADIKKASMGLIGAVMMGGDPVKNDVLNYFGNLATQSPFAKLASDRLAAHPDLANALPTVGGFRDTVVSALTSMPKQTSTAVAATPTPQPAAKAAAQYQPSYVAPSPTTSSVFGPGVSAPKPAAPVYTDLWATYTPPKAPTPVTSVAPVVATPAPQPAYTDLWASFGHAYLPHGDDALGIDSTSPLAYSDVQGPAVNQALDQIAQLSARLPTMPVLAKPVVAQVVPKQVVQQPRPGGILSRLMAAEPVVTVNGKSVPYGTPITGNTASGIYSAVNSNPSSSSSTYNSAGVSINKSGQMVAGSLPNELRYPGT